MPPRETVEAYGLGAIGAVKGVYEVFIKPALPEVRPSTKAWAVILGGALLYDVYAANRLDGETLSERYLDFQEKHPVLAIGSLAITVGHLTDTIRDDRDIFHVATDWLRR